MPQWDRTIPFTEVPTPTLKWSRLSTEVKSTSIFHSHISSSSFTTIIYYKMWERKKYQIPKTFKRGKHCQLWAEVKNCPYRPSPALSLLFWRYQTFKLLPQKSRKKRVSWWRRRAVRLCKPRNFLSPWLILILDLLKSLIGWGANVGGGNLDHKETHSMCWMKGWSDLESWGTQSLYLS